MEQAQVLQIIRQIVQELSHPVRTPVFRRPDEYGLEYEDIWFNAIDGIRLEGWFIPAASDKLIICNHFGPGNRYGYAGHLEAFASRGGFEVNFLPKYKALHDAGYNIIAYDLRDHGLSGASGVNGFSLFEWRDVIGALRYAGNRAETAAMKTSLHTMCLGCNATMIAMEKHPREFAHIQSMIAIQPVLGRAMIEKICTGYGIDPGQGTRLYDEELRKVYGFRLDDYDIVRQAGKVTVPTLLVQVKDDLSMQPEAIEKVYRALATNDKKLHWIEGTSERFKGYCYFSERPELMLDWYDSHM